MAKTNWLQYDWNVRGVPAIFTVDMSYGAPVEGYQTLLWLSCVSKRAKATAFDAGEIRAAEKALKRAMSALDGALYVGCIDLPAQRQYYFYTEREEDLELMHSKEKKLDLDCGRAHEPRWQTYFKLLYPDIAKSQTVENARMIQLFASKGDQLHATRRVSLFVFFHTEPTRLMFEEEARLNGFAIGNPLFKPEQEMAYGTTIYCLSSLQKRAVDAITTRVIRIAQAMDGMLMGWNCPIVQKNTLS